MGPGRVKSRRREMRWDVRRLFAASKCTKWGERDELASVLGRICGAVPSLSKKCDFSHTLGHLRKFPARWTRAKRPPGFMVARTADLGRERGQRKRWR